MCVYLKKKKRYFHFPASNYLPTCFTRASLHFSVAGFGEQQFCLHLIYHLHDFVNFNHILPQMSLCIDKSQSFALSWQGRWLILGLFSLPFSLISLQTPLCPSGDGEAWNVPALQFWVHQSFIWRQNDTFCLVFMPVLICSIFCWFFWWPLHPVVMVSENCQGEYEGSFQSRNCQFQVQHHTGQSRWGFPLGAVFLAIYLHLSSSKHLLCFVGPFWSFYYNY